MLFRNLTQIVADNYTALAGESTWPGRIAWGYVGTVFIVFPVAAGIALSFVTPIWSGLLGTLAPVFGVLTGFSINAIMLLTRHSEEDSYDLETHIVQETRKFTLYSILVGLTLIGLLVGVLIASKSTVSIPYDFTRIVSAGVYTMMIHYFLTLLVITHRLHSLIEGGAINNA